MTPALGFVCSSAEPLLFLVMYILNKVKGAYVSLWKRFGVQELDHSI